MLDRLSIRAKLTAAFVAAMILVLALAAWVVYLRVDSELSGSLENNLTTRTDDLGALIASSGPSGPNLEGGRLVEGDEVFSQVLDPDGQPITSTLAPATTRTLTSGEVQSAREGGTVLIDEREVPGVEATAMILARSIETPSGEFIVVAGASNEDRNEALAGLSNTFLIGAPIALLLVSGLGYLLAGRAMRPVEAMRARAAEITLERNGERLPLSGADDEIRHLGETLNTMLDRIESSLERERVFVADASHELRTPLSILKTELELADREQRSPEELRKAVGSAAEEVDRLSQLAEDLLVIARSDHGGLPIKREPTELRTVLDRVRDRFARRAGEAGREITVAAPADTEVELDPLRIEQALGNLVDNALRHGRGQVELSAARDSSQAVFEVSDRGPGFPDGFRVEAFDRFTRADEGRTGGGAGLGLSIARAIAAAHGGDAEVTDNGDPRTTVRISIPAGAS